MSSTTSATSTTMSTTSNFPWLVGNYIAENFIAEALVITGDQVGSISNQAQTLKKKETVNSA